MIPISKPVLGNEEIKAAVYSIKSGNLIQGEMVKMFDHDFSKYIGIEHGIACSSGTSALKIALVASGIDRGDEVITTPFTFIATSNSILYAGAKPVFADINPKTFNIDPVKISEKIKNCKI